MSIELEQAPQEIHTMQGMEQLGALDILEARWAEGKFLCVGLDVVADESATLFEKAQMIVDATRDIAAAYKPNDAFYASLGSNGIAQMEQLVDYVKNLAPEILVIWDSKRADIANTNNGYAKQRELLRADSMTIQPYLGGIAVEPLLTDPNKLGIVLAHTSNPGADEFQHLQLQSGEPLWERVVKNVAHDHRWKHGSPVGIVMGATYPDLIARARYLAGNETVMLVPGIGKQGGDLEASVWGAMNDSGTGFLINVSSGISGAEDSNGVVTEESIRQAAISYDQDIKRVHQETLNNPGPSYYARSIFEFDSKLVATMVDVDVLRFGEFRLRSGAFAPVYIDNRNFITEPMARNNVAQLFVDLVLRQEANTGVQADYIAGNPQSGLTWAALVADRLGRKLVQPRAGGTKDHGTGKLVEGVYQEGESVTLIEDLVTTAASVFETVDEKLVPSGLGIAGAVSLVCRDQLGLKNLAERGIPYEHAITLPRIMDALILSGKLEEQGSAMENMVLTYLGRK